MEIDILFNSFMCLAWSRVAPAVNRRYSGQFEGSKVWTDCAFANLKNVKLVHLLSDCAL